MHDVNMMQLLVRMLVFVWMLSTWRVEYKNPFHCFVQLSCVLFRYLIITSMSLVRHRDITP